MTAIENTSGAFLNEIAQTLKAGNDVDADLAGILAEHILTPIPTQDCVEEAMVAINALAVARIAASKENAGA